MILHYFLLCIDIELMHLFILYLLHIYHVLIIRQRLSKMAKASEQIKSAIVRVALVSKKENSSKGTAHSAVVTVTA